MLNPIFQRASQQQQQQTVAQDYAETQQPVGETLNITNLNNKTASSEESQTISVNYNLLHNDDIVRWNDTEVKLRAPTGLTTINRVKFRSFVGDLLPYTSLQLPELHCDIVAYVIPQYVINYAGGKATAEIIGVQTGNFNVNAINVTNYNPTTIASYNKPWTYSASEESQIEYNIEEMLKYVNDSFEGFLGNLLYQSKYCVQAMTNIVKNKWIFYMIESLTNKVLFPDDSFGCMCFANYSQNENANFAYSPSPNTGIKLKSINYNSNTYIYQSILLCYNSFADAFTASSNDLMWTIGFTYYLTTDKYYIRFPSISSTATNISYAIVSVRDLVVNGFNRYSYCGCYRGMVLTYYQLAFSSIDHNTLYVTFWPRTSGDLKGFYTTKLRYNEIYENVGALEKYGKAVDCSCVYCYCYCDSAYYYFKCMFAVAGYDANNEVRVVYDYAEFRYNSAMSNSYNTKIYYTRTFDEGITLTDYNKYGLWKRDFNHYDFDRVFTTTTDNTTYVNVGDRYFFTVNSSGQIITQPIPLLTERFYANTAWYVAGPSAPLENTDVVHNRIFVKASNLSNADAIQRIVNNKCFAGFTNDLTVNNSISYEDYDKILTIPSALGTTDSVNYSLLLCKRYYENLEAKTNGTAEDYDITGLQENYYSLTFNGQIKDSTGTYGLANTTSDGEATINYYNNEYFSYTNGTMRYPYVSFSGSYCVAFVPSFYTDPYYFKTSVKLPESPSNNYTIASFSYEPELKLLNNDVLQLLETLLLLQYEYNDLMLRCSNFPNNDNIVFSVNEICRIAFKVMQTNSTNFELCINICDSSGGSISLETLKRLYGKLQLSVEFER